jgi:hypothetical protein
MASNTPKISHELNKSTQIKNWWRSDLLFLDNVEFKKYHSGTPLIE